MPKVFSLRQLSICVSMDATFGKPAGIGRYCEAGGNFELVIVGREEVEAFAASIAEADCMGAGPLGGLWTLTDVCRETSAVLFAFALERFILVAIDLDDAAGRSEKDSPGREMEAVDDVLLPDPFDVSTLSQSKLSSPSMPSSKSTTGSSKHTKSQV